MQETTQLAQVFKALAHPLRVRILEILQEEECCVCHLAAVTGRRQPYVSQQLTRLRQAGLIADRKEGTIVYNRLANDRVYQLLAAARAFLAAQGVEIRVAPVPRSPVPGCPCPRCTEDGRCC